jgi:hypothetical protein
MDNVIKVATAPFWCPKCGTLVRTGENYIEDGGRKLCMCALPDRKLKSLRSNCKVQSFQCPARIEYEKVAKHLRIENIKMRYDLEIISENPDGTAAKKIIARYRKIRNEQNLSVQN